MIAWSLAAVAVAGVLYVTALRGASDRREIGLSDLLAMQPGRPDA